jgi:hypothetical protein
MAFLVSNSWRCWSKIPRVSYLLCFSLILSHILADALLTSAPVSFWYPLELNSSVGHSGWREVIESVLFGAFRDLGGKGNDNQGNKKAKNESSIHG